VLIDGGTPGLLAGLVLLQHPTVFLTPDPALKPIAAEHKVLVARHPLLDADGKRSYDPAIVQSIAEKLVGDGILWAPRSPTSRDNLIAGGLPFELLPNDLSSVVFVEDWAADRRSPVGAKPVIGRHSRPEAAKWPASREAILQVYPDSAEVEVRILGAGEPLAQLMGGRFPSNWTLFGFNELDPAAFLRTIDFFVYYHHPAWVEVFGRSIAEAAASGAVVVLPEGFRRTFGQAAIYRSPALAIETVRDLYADWPGYLEQSTRGQEFVRREFGPERFVAQVREMIGRPRAGRSVAALPRGATDVVRFDTVRVADFRRIGEPAWRIAEEVRIEAEAGYRCGLAHVDIDGPNRLDAIHPAIDALVRVGAASPIEPAASALRTELLMAMEPAALLASIRSGKSIALPRLAARRVIAVAEGTVEPASLRQQHSLLQALFGANVLWTAADAGLYVALNDSGLACCEMWRPALTFRPPRSSYARAHPRKLVLGAIGVIGASMARLRAGRDAAVALREIALPSAIDLAHSTSPSKLWNGVDLLACFPDAGEDIPVHVIASAMAAGIPVILPNSLEPRFGAGAALIYAPARDIAALARELHADPPRLAALRDAAAEYARVEFAPSLHIARVSRIVGSPAAPPRSKQAQAQPRRVLFFASNGAGMGHLMRLLAVARRMPTEIAPVFVTLSQAIPVVELAGYPVEYLPFHAYANCDRNDWGAWLMPQLAQIIDFYRPAAVVFDGAMPYGGLIKATASRDDVKLVWLRRGMWRAEVDHSAAMERQRYFDLVVEPSDIAEAVDRGPTSLDRSAVVKLPPISLLDPEDLFSSEDAARRLRLDPARPAVLIQLGSGWKRDLAAMNDAVLAVLSERPAIQPVVAEWMIADAGLTSWPQVPRLKAFPIARYYNAFDFTISAAGYNSFNEIVSFGIPAIFVAHGDADDQPGRAAFAEQNGAAFCVPEADVRTIGPMVDALLDERLRMLMKANCGRLARGNGARDAAQAIVDLIG
jgi:UDP:flavonoid glycosyltransferase YjiC (YdhE family)/glycosyltransferase involved in cell wall biosynthesis